jgi:hypothetical protein
LDQTRLEVAGFRALLEFDAAALASSGHRRALRPDFAQSDARPLDPEGHA